MLFNSLHFAIFLPIVFVIYWLVAGKTPRRQNILLLIASYFFYACWDWRFLFLLVFSTMLDYVTGIKIAQAKNLFSKKIWLWISIFINLGFLGIFKYYNFFVNSFAESISHLGLEIHPWTLSIILPVGISFYTFHGLSYVIDLYKGKIRAEKNWIDYAVFVSFFPLLVAGPIERASHLLPQIRVNRPFNQNKAVDGLRQILWGLFKKIVIADGCAHYVNMVFDHPEQSSGSTIAVGVLFFALQIYCDFSGYSDIALGTAKLFGIDLLRNFSFPYFSRDIAEFWRRWHISLSSWFRDYLYIPLGGNQGGTWKKIRNTFLVFIISGFWHGANWTFIVWGLLHAIYFLPLLLLNKNRIHLNMVAQGKYFPTFKELSGMLITFCLTSFAWIFFRSDNLAHAGRIISGIFSTSFFTLPEIRPTALILLIGFFLATEWLGRERQYAISHVGIGWKRPVRWAFYYTLIIAIFYFAGTEQVFIYFQF